MWVLQNLFSNNPKVDKQFIGDSIAKRLVWHDARTLGIQSRMPRDIQSEMVDGCNLDEDQRSSTEPFVRGTP